MSSVAQVPELVVGIAAGAAASAALDPALEVPKQDAWSKAAHRLPDIGLIAQLYTTGNISQADATNMALRLGFDTPTFNMFAYLAQEVPSFAEVLRMWRLGAYFPVFADLDKNGLVDHSLAHSGLDWDYHTYLRALQTAELPGIGDIAYAVVRGYLPTTINLPVAPPTTSTYVPRFPQSATEAETLAAAIGYDKDILELMIARSGLSMAPVMAANAYFRTQAKLAYDNLPADSSLGDLGLSLQVADDDYRLAIAEGDLRTEWADAVRETARAILSPGEYAELHLRGWLTQQERDALASQHGTSPGNADLLYKLKRRPLNPHQIKQALARGATFNPAPGEIADPYTASVHQANLGPEWYEMGVALQGSYPSLFITNRLVTSGIINPTDGADWLTKAGTADEVVTAMSTSWTAGGTTTTDKHVTKAQTTLYTTTHKSYMAYEISDATATTALGAAGVAAAAIPSVLSTWQEERSLIRKGLSAANIKKAFTDLVQNPATGQPWTKADAIARLLDLGYSNDDATTYLEL